MGERLFKRRRGWCGRLRRVAVAGLWVGLVLAYGVVVFALVWRGTPGSMTRADAALTFGAMLIETFAFHAGLVVLAGLVVALVLRAWATAVVSAPMVVWCLGPAVWLMVRPMPSPAAEGAATLTVLSVNLMYGRADAEALVGMVERERPDVVCLQEYTPGAHAALVGELMRAGYVHVVASRREDAFGQAVFSRLAFVGEARKTPAVGEWRVPQTTVVVEVGGRPVSVTNVHLYPPAGLALVREQRRQAAWLAAAVTACEADAVVLAGDFNAPIWTGHLRELRAAGLVGAHASAGRGRGSTWCAVGWKRWSPGVRLDHVLSAGGLRCVESRVLGAVGSDHRPVVARFEVLGTGGSSAGRE